MSQLGDGFISEKLPGPASRYNAIRQRYLLGLIVLVGALLRIAYLSRSLWGDEPATIITARLPWSGFTHLWWYGEAAYQGAYFLLMRGWFVLGHGEAWLRLPSVLFSILSILLIYPLARKLAGDQVAIVSAALLAFSPTDVYYSQEARSYTMTILLVMIASWFFIHAVETNRERHWLAWTFVSVLAVYTHFFAALVVVAHVGSLLACRRAGRFSRSLVHGILILLASSPALGVVFRLPANSLSFDWMPRPTPKQLLHVALFLGGSGEKIVVSTILWVAAVRAIWRRRCDAESSEFWHGAFVVSWAVTPVFVTAMVSLEHPMFVQRYMIFSLPAALILAAWGATAIPRQRLGFWLAVLWCASSLLNVFLGYYKPREDWRGATRGLISAAQSGDAVLVYPDYASPGFDYYYEVLGRGTPALRVYGPFYGNHYNDQDLRLVLESEPRNVVRVWVLLRDQGPAKKTLQDYSPTMARELQSRFGNAEVQQYEGLTLLKFEI